MSLQSRCEELYGPIRFSFQSTGERVQGNEPEEVQYSGFHSSLLADMHTCALEYTRHANPAITENNATDKIYLLCSKYGDRKNINNIIFDIK